jgi:hypothetical protein
MSYCEDHVYMPDKIDNKGDFAHVLHKVNNCPYCQIEKLTEQNYKYREALNKIAIMQSFAERGCLSGIIASEALEAKHGNSNSL